MSPDNPKGLESTLKKILVDLDELHRSYDPKGKYGPKHPSIHAQRCLAFQIAHL